MEEKRIPGQCDENTALVEFRREICDAMELMAYAIESGKQVPDAVIDQIERMRTTNPGQARAAFHRAGVSEVTSETFL